MKIIPQLLFIMFIGIIAAPFAILRFVFCAVCIGWEAGYMAFDNVMEWFRADLGRKGVERVSEKHPVDDGSKPKS